MTTTGHENSVSQDSSIDVDERSRRMSFLHYRRVSHHQFSNDTKQDAAAATASLQRLMTDLEFQGGGGLTPMILNSTLRSACSADEWRKLRKLDREPGPQSSHSISLDQNSIPPDPGWGYKTEDCNTCDPGQTAEAPTSSDGKRKQRSSDENSESQRCSSGTKTEEENEGHPKGGSADHKRNRAAVRKYRQKKKDQRESLEVEVDLLRKETERLRAQIDAQDASAALCVRFT